MAQSQRALTDLEDLGSVPSIYIISSQQPVIPVPEDLLPTSGLHRY